MHNYLDRISEAKSYFVLQVLTFMATIIFPLYLASKMSNLIFPKPPQSSEDHHAVQVFNNAISVTVANYLRMTLFSRFIDYVKSNLDSTIRNEAFSSEYEDQYNFDRLCEYQDMLSAEQRKLSTINLSTEACFDAALTTALTAVAPQYTATIPSLAFSYSAVRALIKDAPRLLHNATENRESQTNNRRSLRLEA